jgi:hypothetical protein
VVCYRAVLTGISVIAACAALVATGVVFAVRWGSGASAAGRGAGRQPVPYVALALAAGAAAGVLAAGAGGRLVMRLLAATSPQSDGAITEGAARIGDITVGGTLGFFAFAGLAAGGLSAALYVLLGSLLPRGRGGGVALGAVLLVLAGARLDPLRADNFEFNLVGPDWLSLLSFTGLAVFQGMVTWAIMGRLNLHPLTIGGRRFVALGRATAGVVVLAALPGFASAVADILSYGGT